MIFRLSQKLAKKLKEGALTSLPLDENPYADWSAHLFTAHRTQYIILTNTKSLYSVVICGKGIPDDGYVEVSLEAECDGQIVGHILFSRLLIITGVGAVQALSLAPMAVLPCRQRQGIGSPRSTS